jgi:hypothetical protein
MTVWLLVLAAAAVVLVVVAVTVRRRAIAREAQRAQELGRLAERLGLSLAQVHAPKFPPIEPSIPEPGAVAPLVADRLPGRAAFLEAVAAEVERAKAGAARLTAALVRAGGDVDSGTLVVAVDEIAGRRAYAVGPSAVAFTLPGLGRADGLAALARIESRAPSSGRAVEWKPAETPVELVARLLEEPRD